MRGKMIGGGGGTIDTDELTATASEVTEGLTFYGKGTDEEQTGTLPNKINKGSSYGKAGNPEVPIHDAVATIVTQDTAGNIRIAMAPPHGVYPGDDQVYVGCYPIDIGISADLIANGHNVGGITGTYGSDGNVKSSDIRPGKVAYGASGRVVGDANDAGQVVKTLSAGESYSIVEGYYGNGKITAKDLASQTQANANAYDVLSGKTFYKNGTKYTGSFPNRGQYQYGGIGEAGDYYAINGLPEGAYFSQGVSWAPEARIKKDTLRNYLGVAAWKIISGQSIAGISGTQHTYAYSHGSVNSDSGRFLYDSGASYYYCRLSIGFEPILAVFCHYHSSRLRDITVCSIDPSGAISSRMLNFNQARMGGMYSYGFANGEQGAYFGKGNLLIPVAYGGSTYQYWIVGYN